MRQRLFGIFFLALGLIAAMATASIGAAPQGDQKSQAQADAKNAKSVAVIGCIAAGEQNGYILTAEPSDINSGMAATTQGAVPSVTYQLMGGDQGEIAKLVGQRVEVKGRTDAKPKAQAKMQSKSATEEKKTAKGDTPKIETTAKTKIEVDKLNVASVKAIGGPCRTK